MQSPTKDLEKVKEVAKQLSDRNQCSVFVFTIRNGHHDILYHEIYLEGAPELRFFKGEPDAIIEFQQAGIDN